MKKSKTTVIFIKSVLFLAKIMNKNKFSYLDKYAFGTLSCITDQILLADLMVLHQIKISNNFDSRKHFIKYSCF